MVRRGVSEEMTLEPRPQTDEGGSHMYVLRQSILDRGSSGRGAKALTCDKPTSGKEGHVGWSGGVRRFLDRNPSLSGMLSFSSLTILRLSSEGRSCSPTGHVADGPTWGPRVFLVPGSSSAGIYWSEFLREKEVLQAQHQVLGRGKQDSSRLESP